MPWGDWQFWLVTLAAGWAVRAVVRPLFSSRGKGEPACPSCAVGTAARVAIEQREEGSSMGESAGR